MTYFFQQLINGITVGSVYALIALGYTMVYGVLELINFAHGEIYMIGAYLGVIFLAFLPAIGFSGSPYGLLFFSLLLSAFLCGAYGVAVEKIAYKPLRNAPRLSPLISALGMSIFLQNYVMLTQGTRNKVYPDLFTIETLDIYGLKVSIIQIIIVLFSFLLMFTLNIFINKTRIGMAMRAVAQDKTMSLLIGINMDRIVVITFIIGSVLASAAGVMIGIYYGAVIYSIGFLAGIKAFTAAVLGGIGNIQGAVLGGLLLGVVESFGAGYISTEYKDVFAFLILVFVLVFKPSGMLGEYTQEKV